MKTKNNTKTYFIFLIVILTFVYVVDEIASNINSSIQPYAIIDLFKIPNGDFLSTEYTSAVGFITTFSVLSYVLMLIAPFYKALADKYGRKIFLVVNTAIMGIGMGVMLVAPNVWIYILGTILITFVMSNDMQVMYIIETVPAEHRAKVCNFTKAIGLMGVSIIGALKGAFYDSSVPASWRKVLIIPALMGIVIALLALIFIRETPVFLSKKTSGNSEGVETDSSNTSSKTGVIPAIKFIFSDSQMRKIVIVGLVFAIATGITNYYTTILEASRSTGVITADAVTTIMIVFPFVNGVMTLICGFISDACGRKNGAIIFSIIATIGLTVFVLGARYGTNPFVIAIAYGSFIGTLWSVTDTLVLVMTAESTPTSMRASVMGVMSLILSFGMMLAIIVFVVGLQFAGSADIGLVSLIICLPFMIVSCFLLGRLKETKGADLDSI